MMTNADFPVINLPLTGRNIERCRRDAGMSVRELQAYFGFEYPQAIYKWQHGECLPTVDNLLALSRILHVRMEDLLVCEDQEAIFFGKQKTDYVSRKDSHDPPFLIHYISLQNIISQKQKVVFECQHRMQLSSPDQVLDILTGTVQEFSSRSSIDHIILDIGTEISLCQREKHSFIAQLICREEDLFAETHPMTSCCQRNLRKRIPVERKALPLFLMQTCFREKLCPGQSSNHSVTEKKEDIAAVSFDVVL